MRVCGGDSGLGEHLRAPDDMLIGSVPKRLNDFSGLNGNRTVLTRRPMFASPPISPRMTRLESVEND